MKIEIVSQKRNELLKRTEVSFRLDHEDSGTPSRLEARGKLADMFAADSDKVYIRKLKTRKGKMAALGEARIYDSLEAATFAEPEHIILRNKPKEEKKE